MKTKEAVGQLAGLAQQTRLRIFRMLVKLGEEGLPAGEIGSLLGVPPPTLSVHLARLEQAGMLDSKRRQRQIIYKIREEGIQQLLCFLVEDCCGGNQELCGFPVSGLKTEKNKN